MYGMSMRPVPKTWEEFCEYWDRVCSEELEINRATLDIFSIRIPKPWFVLMPTPIWDQLFKPMVGRTALDRRGPVRPGGAREGRHALDAPATRFCCGCSASWSRWRSSSVPDEIRLHPRALAAYRRASGRLPDDAPLVEAPAFMAPPSDRRDLPMHYVPRRKSLLDRAGSLVHTTFSLAGPAPGARPQHGGLGCRHARMV